MKLPAHEYLELRKIPFRCLQFPPDTEKGAANVAIALGFRERQMVKTLIFEADTGEKVLIMLGGDQSAKSGNLKRVVGSRNIRMAAPEVVKEVTGYQIGSIPPFSWQPKGFRTFLEQSLLGEAELGVGTGQWGEEIVMAPSDLLKAAEAVAVELVG